MARLGHERFLAHGGDWGSLVTQAIATTPAPPCRHPHHLASGCTGSGDTGQPLPEELQALEAFNFYQEWDSGYSKQQSTRPQTPGYGLADSPTGQLAWIVEKYAQWCDCERNGVRHLRKRGGQGRPAGHRHDVLADQRGRKLRAPVLGEFQQPDMGEVTLPTGISLFPNEIMRSSERWARKKFLDLMYFNDKIEAGGHFAALEVPETLAGELWRWRQELRTRGIVD